MRICPYSVLLAAILALNPLKADVKQVEVPTSKDFPFQVGLNESDRTGPYFVERAGKKRKFFFERNGKGDPIGAIYEGGTHPGDAEAAAVTPEAAKEIIRWVKERLRTYHGQAAFELLAGVSSGALSREELQFSPEEPRFNEMAASIVLLESLSELAKTINAEQATSRNRSTAVPK